MRDSGALSRVGNLDLVEQLWFQVEPSSLFRISSCSRKDGVLWFRFGSQLFDPIVNSLPRLIAIRKAPVRVLVDSPASIRAHIGCPSDVYRSRPAIVLY